LQRDGAVLRRDGFGIALGGVRTPPVDVPVAVESGEAPAGSKALCVLYGSSRAFAASRLKTLYGTKAQYLNEFDAATRQAVSAGYVLSDDEAALEQQARAVMFPA
jgi:hypothetical protein